MDNLISYEGAALKKFKHYIAINALKGVDCPCCAQKVKIQERKYMFKDALCLLELVANTKLGEAIHVSDLCKLSPIFAENCRGGSFFKTRFFGVIEEGEGSGTWKYTEKGLKFLQGECEISPTIRTYNRKFIGKDKEELSIFDLKGGEQLYLKLVGMNINISQGR